MPIKKLRALFVGASASALCVVAIPTLAYADTAMAEAAMDEASTQVEALVVKAERKQTHATIEAVTDAEIHDTVNAMNVEDTLKYLPSLVVRKRHIGDTQAPLATRTSGLGASARTLIYADDILLSALIGNNNSTASPRWGMVSPEEIKSVTFLYGPFSAAYAGNSIGGVLNIRTSAPEKREGSLHLAGSSQSFDQYATSGTFAAAQVSGTFGDRIGALWYRLSGNVVESSSQPLTYVTATRPASTSTTGTVVTGPFADVNRTNAAIGVFGAGGLEHQVESNLRAKVGYEFPSAELVYSLGRFANNTDSKAETYARDAAGAPVYSGTLNFGGYAYSLAASAFSNNVYARDDEHWMQSLSLASRGDGPWTWRLAASVYDYGQDQVRTPSTALPGALVGGAGSVSRLDGTGWNTFDGQASRSFGAHALTFGAHADQVQLKSARYNLADWVSGPDGALAQAARGKTTTQGLWAQDAITLTDTVKLTLGARYEDWRATGGYNFSLTPALAVNQPKISAAKVSPKATLEWAATEHWFVTASYGEAYRFPTVTELYQAITTGTTLTVPNPNLKPEHAYSAELALERTFDQGRFRVSLFSERIDDALISQTAPLVTGSTTLFSYVQNVDRTKISGLEAAVEYRDVLFKGLDLSASATWTDPKIDRDTAFAAAVGKQIPGVPKFKATLVATYRPNDRWAITIAGRHADRLYASIDNSDVVTHTYQGFDPYTVVDTRVTYRINDHWQAAAGVDNAFDRRYLLFHPFPGRTAMAELNYRF